MESSNTLTSVAIDNDDDVFDNTSFRVQDPNIQVECDSEDKIGDDVDEDGMELDDLGQESKSKKRKAAPPPRSDAWTHFEKFIDPSDNVQKGKCKYCSRVIKAGSKKHGTTSLKKHLEICKKKPRAIASNQPRVAFQPACGGEKEARMVNWQFDQGKVRSSLCRMLVIDELPFKTVENTGFRQLMKDCCPMFAIPSRRTITRDLLNMWNVEREAMVAYIRMNASRICLTTDTWTSIQRVNYMCLTAHFIDNDWKLQKRIIIFCPITGHKSDELGKALEKCLDQWGITEVFSVTVDNASSNDGAISYLIKQLERKGTLILGGKYIHVRCAAHILNLIVQDGLKNKEEHVVISRVRHAIRYIKSSPLRYKRFKECVKAANICSEKLLILDVSTRWNSTYTMLEHAFTLRKAFDIYADVDMFYLSEISKHPFEGHPLEEDWERVALLLKFLEHFYNVTVAISGSKHITSNVLFHQISGVEVLLGEWLESEDVELKNMSRRMKEKFDKYWGPSDKLNLIAYYAIVLDPQWKLTFLDQAFDTLYDGMLSGCEKVAMLKEKVRSGIKELYNAYKAMYDSSNNQMGMKSSQPESSTPLKTASASNKSVSLIQKFIAVRTGEQSKSELEKYLTEENEVYREDFDILGWWKINCHRFPILSQIARDIFAIPVSTVASEATFSTGGRVLDAFRSSLTPAIVEALICLQDWLRLDGSNNIEENLNDLESLEIEFNNTTVLPTTSQVR